MGWKSTMRLNRKEVLERIGALLLTAKIDVIVRWSNEFNKLIPGTPMIFQIRAADNATLENLLEDLEDAAGPTGSGYYGHNFIIEE